MALSSFFLECRYLVAALFLRSCSGLAVQWGVGNQQGAC